MPDGPESPGNGTQVAPLQLRSVTIRRFRSLYDVGPLPIQPDLTVLTGENDGGKSAFLDAIAFLLGSRALDDGDHSHWANEVEPIEVEGEFVPLGAQGADGTIRIRARRERGGVRQCEVLDRVHPGFGTRPEDLPLDDLRNRMATLGIPSPRGHMKAPYVAAAKTWLAARPATEFDDGWRPLTRAESERLPRFTHFTSAAAPDPTTTIAAVIQREARRLLAGEVYRARLEEIGGAVQEEVTQSIQHLQQKIREYCPDLDAVDIRASFDFGKPALDVDLLVRRQGALFDLEKAGEGRRRRITLAIHEANLRTMAAEAPTSTDLLAYDEPDTHLDYASQRALFDILTRQAGLPHVQVLVVTHSLNFIDKVPLQALLHFRLNAELKTFVEVLVGEDYADELNFLASVCAGLGLRNSVLLDERCFLVVEGETEEAALPSLFRLVMGQSLLAAGIALLNTGGSGAARRLIEILARNWQRRVVLLLDTDARGDPAGGKKDAWLTRLALTPNNGAFFVGSKEFEDAFSDEVWLRVLREHFPARDGGADWTLDELAALRASATKYSEALRDRVRERCRDHNITKPDLGWALGRTCKAPEDVPEALRACFQFAQQLACTPASRTSSTCGAAVVPAASEKPGPPVSPPAG